ncbi:MAG: hypothetical protein QNK37_04035 [Acidobacteriota bacterium]|nr:hypothetical protein [Acidobacteriota bacterium]
MTYVNIYAVETPNNKWQLGINGVRKKARVLIDKDLSFNWISKRNPLLHEWDSGDFICHRVKGEDDAYSFNVETNNYTFNVLDGGIGKIRYKNVEDKPVIVYEIGKGTDGLILVRRGSDNVKLKFDFDPPLPGPDPPLTLEENEYVKLVKFEDHLVKSGGHYKITLTSNSQQSTGIDNKELPYSCNQSTGTNELEIDIPSGSP